MEDRQNALIAARERLLDVTPLLGDCGAHCGAACCVSPEDGMDETGMLLFPGEIDLYTQEDARWMRVIPSNLYFQGEPVGLLICDGTCPRDRRPLSCRFFPLAPRFARDGLALAMDARGEPVCPLVDSGVGGLRAEFVQAVGEAFACLMRDARQAEFLRLIDKQIKSYKRLSRSLFP